MKKIIYIIPILFILLSCDYVNVFTIRELNGKFNDYNGKYIYALHEDFKNGEIIDTISVRNGEFKYNINLNDDKTPIYILSEDLKPITILFLKEGEEINLSGSSNPYKTIISGEESNILIGEFLNNNSDILFKYDSLKNCYSSNYTDSVYIKEISQINDSIVTLATQFVNKNTSSSSATFILYNYIASPKYRTLTRVLSEGLKPPAKTEVISSRVEQFAAYQNIDKGKVLPYSQIQSPKDSLIYSFTYKNKITILTFWDSSDSISINKVRDMELFYDTLKQKEKVSLHCVSLDIDKDNWKRVIKKENLKSWQTLLPDGWLNKDVTTINIRKVPTIFLLNRNGVIIGRELEYDSLNYLIGKTIINNDSLDIVRKERNKR